MKKTIMLLLKILAIILIVVWGGLIVVEYSRYRNNDPMLVVLKEDIKSYPDGHVRVYYGLGYKEIIYERTSIYGREFGHIFIKVRDKVPESKGESNETKK